MELVNKYAWLADTIYNAGRITFEEINQKWEDYMNGEEPLAPRTFHRWKNAAETTFNIIIDCDRSTNEYYIHSRKALERGGFRRWLLETASLQGLLHNKQNIADRIIIEEIPSAQQFLDKILRAMQGNHRICIRYQSFRKENSYTFTVEPYCLRCFRQRWYVLANSTYEQKLRLYSLDRIKELEIIEKERFKLPKNFSAEEYFSEYFGVIPYEDVPLTTIKLKVSAAQSNYLRTLPLHILQKETEKNAEYSIFTYYLRPTYDFKQAILALGSEAEVISPASFREEIRDEVQSMWKQYSKDK